MAYKCDKFDFGIFVLPCFTSSLNGESRFPRSPICDVDLSFSVKSPGGRRIIIFQHQLLDHRDILLSPLQARMSTRPTSSMTYIRTYCIRTRESTTTYHRNYRAPSSPYQLTVYRLPTTAASLPLTIAACLLGDRLARRPTCLLCRRTFAEKSASSDEISAVALRYERTINLLFPHQSIIEFGLGDNTTFSSYDQRNLHREIACLAPSERC